MFLFILKNYHLYGLFSLTLPYLVLMTWRVAYLLPRKSSLLQISVWWEQRGENVTVAEESVSLYLLFYSAWAREPSEGPYTSHFPIHCTDCALSRCLCFHSWRYGPGALDKHKMWEKFISESSILLAETFLFLSVSSNSRLAISYWHSFLLCPCM